MNRDKARNLRNNLTDAEKMMWKHLRLRQMGGCKFRRQHPLGNYIVDFVCLEKRLIIEVDGGQHVEDVEYDNERTRWLENQGYHVIRFWNNEVLHEIESVKEAVFQRLVK